MSSLAPISPSTWKSPDCLGIRLERLSLHGMYCVMYCSFPCHSQTNTLHKNANYFPQNINDIFCTFSSFGRFDHENWCTHKSSLCTWNLDRKGMKPDKPDTTVDLSCCLTSIAFHPKRPSYIAGASFNGNIFNQNHLSLRLFVSNACPCYIF